MPSASKIEAGTLASNPVFFQPKQVSYIKKLKLYFKHSVLDIQNILLYSISILNPPMTFFFFVKVARGEVENKHRNRKKHTYLNHYYPVN